MSKPAEPSPVKLIVSLIYSDSVLCEVVRKKVSEEFGKEDFVSSELPFDRTRYYEEEMGSGLRRVFITYAPLINRDQIAAIKVRVNNVERNFSENGRRKVNIDPGYISSENLVLATFKGYSHRIYLGQGVFTEVTLIFEKGSFRPLKWTYPDYASPEIVEIMNGVRARYMEGLRKSTERT